MILPTLILAARLYWKADIAQMVARQNHHTHVQLVGQLVGLVHEADGDWHNTLRDSKGNVLVAECIEELPCIHPKIGDTVLVKGITRYDDIHKWPEINPVLEMTIIKRHK